ncbi:MAG: DUF3006 domain-containing protein [Bacillota bacterium]|nr:DUF3006 domain-containing protein [Bacillota bacterium]MDI6637783.1 DUF3006 domain-containing protein [Bacillota bacterium]
MRREREEDRFASGRGRLAPLAVLAVVIVVAVMAVVIAGKAIYSLAGHEGAAGYVSWTGVVDRVESGKAVVIPLGGARGVAVPDDELPSSEVVIPADLLPPASSEGTVLDFAATLRPRKTHSRRAHIEALVLRLNNRRRESPPAP